jgi:hypothetical protein
MHRVRPSDDLVPSWSELGGSVWYLASLSAITWRERGRPRKHAVNTGAQNV